MGRAYIIYGGLGNIRLWGPLLKNYAEFEDSGYRTVKQAWGLSKLWAQCTAQVACPEAGTGFSMYLGGKANVLCRYIGCGIKKKDVKDES